MSSPLHSTSTKLSDQLLKCHRGMSLKEILAGIGNTLALPSRKLCISKTHISCQSQTAEAGDNGDWR